MSAGHLFLPAGHNAREFHPLQPSLFSRPLRLSGYLGFWFYEIQQRDAHIWEGCWDYRETDIQKPQMGGSWQGLERSVSPLLSYHLRMQKVRGFCFVLINEGCDPLSTMTVIEEAAWQSKLSGTKTVVGTDRVKAQTIALSLEEAQIHRDRTESGLCGPMLASHLCSRLVQCWAPDSNRTRVLSWEFKKLEPFGGGVGEDIGI